MDIKRFDTYRGVSVDRCGTKGDVSVVLVDTDYVYNPKEGTEAYELYKQIESGEVIGLSFITQGRFPEWMQSVAPCW